MAQVYIPTPEPIVRPDGRMTEVFQRFLQNVVKNLGLSGTGSVTNTGDLAADALVIGTGGSNIETLGTLGTNIKVLHGNSGGAPNFSAVVENDLSLTDVTTANVLTTRHGFAPKLPNDATKYLDGTGAYTVPTASSGTVTHTGALTDHFVVLGNGTDDIQVIAGIGTSGQVLTSNGAGADPTFQTVSGTGTVTNTGTLTNHALIKGNGGVDVSALASLGTTTTVLHGNASADPTFGAVVEADLSLTNVTTANVTTSAHGFAPILPNDATKYLDGTGSYTVPASSGGTVTHTGALTDHFVVLGNGTDDIQVVAAIGTSGQVLTSNGAGVDPSFQTVIGTGTVTNTGTLTNHALIKGNGGADVSALGSLGTTTTLLHGDASGDPTFGAVVEADLSLTNVTTADVSISAHGFAPILPNDATKFLNGVGAYTVPTGGGGLSIALQTTTLTNAQILALGSTPITVVSAGGSGTAVYVISAQMTSNFAGGAYSNTGIRLRYSGDITDLVNNSTGMLNQTSKRFRVLNSQDILVLTSSVNNVAIEISAAATVTGGNASNSMVVYVTYATVAVL